MYYPIKVQQLPSSFKDIIIKHDIILSPYMNYQRPNLKFDLPYYQGTKITTSKGEIQVDG